jgi:hypothetical protein
MAMCGNTIQRVKILINNKMIEQVSAFRYLGNTVSHYKVHRDLDCTEALEGNPGGRRMKGVDLGKGG